MTARRLSQLDAFFIAFQERTGTPMQLGVELELAGAIDRGAIERALAAVVARCPQLGQRAVRRVFGLAWDGPPQIDQMLRVVAGAGDVATEVDGWRNGAIDPFAEPPVQALWLPDHGVLSIRAHHAVADGQSLIAVAVAMLEEIASAGVSTGVGMGVDSGVSGSGARGLGREVSEGVSAGVHPGVDGGGKASAGASGATHAGTGGSAAAWRLQASDDLLSPARAIRRGKLAAMARYAAWLVRESRADRSARLAVRSTAHGPIDIRDRTVDGAAFARIIDRARRLGVSPATLVCAAWMRALRRFNGDPERSGSCFERVPDGSSDGHGERSGGEQPDGSRGGRTRSSPRDPRPISIELPISARRGAARRAAVGNFISPLVLVADAGEPLDRVAAAVHAQLRTGLRDRAYLAMPLFTAPGRYLPWRLFRRLAANTTWSGFATSHFTWLDTAADIHAELAARGQRSGTAVRLIRQRVYTPVCLHMGAALTAIPWRDALQLFVIHRRAAISDDGARLLTTAVCDELSVDGE